MATSSSKYPSFNVTTGPIMPTGLDMQQLALDAANHLTDAPTDGQLYGRQSGAWTVVPTGGGGGIAEAPSDGTLYGRKSGAWVNLTHNDITDWAAQLANYYPTSNPSGYQTAGQVSAAISAAAYVLAPASTTVLGGIKVDGTSIQAAADGTVSTVLIPMGDNRIINGDCRIDQRWNGASGTANGYTIDRWTYGSSVASKGTWQGAASNLAGFPRQFTFQSSSAYAVVAGDYFVIQQFIEADMVSDFAWGTASAQPVTLSFWAYSTLTGTFGGCLQNFANNRSYPFSYVVSAASTWTKYAITIPGDIAGTWVMSGNAASVIVSFSLGMGSTRSGPANAWASANYLSVPGAVSVVGTNGAGWGMTGVKLEIGSVATPYNRQSLAKSMIDCQRYYQSVNWGINVYVGAQQYVGNLGYFPTMRAAPTAVIAGTIGTDTNVSSNGGVDTLTINSFRMAVLTTGAGNVSAIRTITVSAEL